jgi:hypothetical protein
MAGRSNWRTRTDIRIKELGELRATNPTPNKIRYELRDWLMSITAMQNDPEIIKQLLIYLYTDLLPHENAVLMLSHDGLVNLDPVSVDTMGNIVEEKKKTNGLKFK